MNYSSDASILRRASLGPAAIALHAKQFREINLGIPQTAFVDAEMMRQGGSLGGLGCCFGGPGERQSDRAPPQTVLGPIAVRMIQRRRAGATPQAALLDAIAVLHAQGADVVTPSIHLQLAAGLQRMPGLGLAGFLGSLGLAPVAGAALTSGSVAASAVGVGAATAMGIGAGIALGQTVIPIPVVGAVIGAIVFEAAHLMQRHVGKAEAAWANQGFYNSLKSMNGRDYDEKQFSEAFKGMMDTGSNIVPGCGPDRHKNPDCLLGPMAAVIAQGYLSGAVPLSATTSQVFQTVVKPWLMSGAGGLVNGNTLAGEPIQMLMMQAAADRYLAGQAMTRGDMPAYGNAGAKTPTLVQALQSILQQPTTTTPQTPPGSSAGGPVYLPANPPMTQIQNPPGVSPAAPPSIIPGAGPYALPTYAPSGGGLTYMPRSGGGPAVGYQPSAMPAMTAAGIGSGLPTWLTLGIAVIGIGMVVFRQGPVTSPPKIKRKLK